MLCSSLYSSVLQSAVKIHTCDSNADTVADAVRSLEELSNTGKTQNGLRSLTWVDLVVERPLDKVGESAVSAPVPQQPALSKGLADYLASAAASKRVRLDEAAHHADAADVHCPLAAVDDAVRRIFEAAPAGATVIAVTQGDMTAMRLLASQKMRFVTAQRHSSILNTDIIVQESLGVRVIQEAAQPGGLLARFLGDAHRREQTHCRGGARYRWGRVCPAEGPVALQLCAN